MAVKKHVKMLKQDLIAWNRRKQSDFFADLIGANLTGAKLTGANLTNADLTWANLSGSDLSDANLAASCLSNTNLTGADLCGANLISAKLVDADISSASLTRANLTGANLNHANLDRADLTRANFTRAYLVGTHLTNANLTDANLQSADLTRSNLTDANLLRADIRGANLTFAHLSRANLSGANLSGANLSGADLSGTHLVRANLLGANLAGANLAGANFWGANLASANLTGANVTAVNLSYAKISNTNFGNCDLRVIAGLDSALHMGPSTVGIDTVYKSAGQIPESFLRDCGVPESLITQMRSLVGAEEGFQFHSCFISYSHSNEDFAQRLHEKMRAANLRVWYAPKDMPFGKKLHEEIETQIHLHDKLLLVLSEESMRSEWVATEIYHARQREKKERRQILFPIALCPFEEVRKWESFDSDSGKDMAREVREYLIPDFSQWKTHDFFAENFSRLLKDLRNPDKKVAKIT